MVQSNEGDVNTNSSLFICCNDDFVEIPIIDDISNIDVAPQIQKLHTFHLDLNCFEMLRQNVSILQLQIASNVPINFPIILAIKTPIDKSLGIIYAAIILVGLYVIIIWEIIDRTLASIIASTISIGVLALMNERPTMSEIISWIDAETLLLLFSMMILVGILSETGIFDYSAVYAFKVCLLQFVHDFFSFFLCTLFLLQNRLQMAKSGLSYGVYAYLRLFCPQFWIM